MLCLRALHWLGQLGKIRGTEVEPRGSGQEATPLPRSEGRPNGAEAGLPACPPGELTPQRSPGVPRKQRRLAASPPPPPPPRPKDRAGEGQQLRVRTGRQCLRAASPPRPHGGQPRPGSQGSSGRRSAVGGGEVEKGDCGRLRSSAFRWKDREDGLWRLHLQPPPLPPPPLLPPPPGDAPSIRLQPGDSQPGRGLGPGPPASSESSPELPPAPPTLCPPLRLRPPPHPRAASQPRGRFLSRAPRSP